MRRIRLFFSFQSITIRNNVRRNDVFNVKTITTDATRMRFAFLCVSSCRIQSKKLIDLILSFVSDILLSFLRGAFFPDPISRYCHLPNEQLIFSEKNRNWKRCWKKRSERSSATIVSALKGSERNSLEALSV